MAAIVASALTLASAAVSPEGWNSAVTSSAPLNWYRLDEATGTAAIDYGSQGLDGTYGIGDNAPARGATGLVGAAVAFDGDRKNIVFNGSPLTGDWTAEFILKKTGTKASAELFRGAPLQSPSSHLKLEQFENTGQVGFTESFIADRVFTPPVVAPLDEFVHLVFVRDDGGTKVYLDGLLAGTSSSSVSLYRYQFGDAGGGSPIAVVDEIAVYDRALPPLEIAQHFETIPEPGSVVLALLGMPLLIPAVRNRLRRRLR